jgi:ribosome maturation protein SDO1
MLKQPVGQKLLTNVSIVKLKFGKSRFELACYPNKIQDYRNKKEKDIDEVLQSKEIYTNAIKGDLVPKKVLKEVFPKMTYQDIIKLILDKGDIQTGEKERDEGKANLKRYVSNIIVQKTYNTDNGLPFPQDIITKALDNINFKYNEKDNEKKQAMRGIKELISHKILPIERRLMQLKLTLKKIENENNPILENAEKLQEFNKNLLNYIKEIEAEIIENDTTSVDNFNLKINIKTQYYRDILNKYDKILNIEVLSQDEISQKVKDKIKEKGENNNNNTISTESQKIDEIETHFENMRISDVTVEKYLEENYGDMEENSKSKKNKKKLTCTKCKDSSFNDRDELRQHCKTNWHKYNALQSAKEGISLSAEEYDEYVLMHPEELK